MSLTTRDSHYSAGSEERFSRNAETDLFLGDVREAIREALGGANDAGSRPASLSPSDAANELGLSESVVRKLVNTGELGHRRVGSRILIGQEHIASFLYGTDPRGAAAS